MVNDILHRLEKADDIAHRAVIGSRICAVKGTIDAIRRTVGKYIMNEVREGALAGGAY